MSEDSTERMLGQIDGKLESLISAFDGYRLDHNARHREIDEKLEAHALVINQAKGAKAAILVAAAAISGFVGAAVAAANHLLK